MASSREINETQTYAHLSHQEDEGENRIIESPKTVIVRLPITTNSNES